MMNDTSPVCYNTTINAIAHFSIKLHHPNDSKTVSSFETLELDHALSYIKGKILTLQLKYYDYEFIGVRGHNPNKIVFKDVAHERWVFEINISIKQCKVVINNKVSTSSKHYPYIMAAIHDMLMKELELPKFDWQLRRPLR